jgi:molybdenum cofactor cytidylyltransferase
LVIDDKGTGVKTFAVIPAGGKSSRMGRPKLTLPLGDRTVLEHVIAALRRAAIDHILVVIGPHVPELLPLTEKAGADTLLLSHETADMRATVEAGLQRIETQFSPRPDDVWLLVPADHPTLNASVVERLLQVRASHPEWSILVPTFQAKRGHPALIAWKHVAGMRRLPVAQGLNVYFRQQTAETGEVPVDSAEVLMDLDTPSDYERLRQREIGDGKG